MRALCLFAFVIALAAPAAAQSAPDDAAAAAPAQQLIPKGSVLVLDVRTDNKDGAELARSLSDYLQARLSQLPGRQVISSFEVAQMMDLEAQKAAVGCDDAGCIAEIASAMDTDTVIFSRLSRLGDKWMLRITFYDARDGRAKGRLLVAAEDEEVLLKRMDRQLTRALVGNDGGGGPRRAKSGGVSWLMVAGTGGLGFGLVAGGLAVATTAGLMAFGGSDVINVKENPALWAVPVASGVVATGALVLGGAALGVGMLSE